jgi:hypothetical protein
LKKGIDLIDLFGKIMLLGMAVLFGLAFIFGPILLFIGFGFFFIFPILESVSTFYYKWLYRNIIVAKGFIDEEADTWEKFKWRIIKVVDFKTLPKVLHDLYMKNIKENYKDLIRDKGIDKINKKFLITSDGSAKPIGPIPENPSLKNKIIKKQIEFKDDYELEVIEEKKIEEAEDSR